ncbi:MAG: 50S ribosomal protein L6 [Candidatus Micrarchaeia archaeon]
MQEIDIQNGVTVSIDKNKVTIKGKLGSCTKTFNERLFSINHEGQKLKLITTNNKKLLKKAALAEQAFGSELKNSIKGVQEGLETKMTILYAHFPMSLDIKGKTVFVKNIFGERFPRETTIVGDTKIEVKGQSVVVKGVDAYDVGQTVANLRKICYARGNDTRVFQDGIYKILEE